jgi:3-mercaptopyruvate sulfurtransferase SseA
MTNLKGKNTLDNEEEVRKFLKKCGKFVHVANDWSKYSTGHIKNSILMTSLAFRSTTNYTANNVLGNEMILQLYDERYLKNNQDLLFKARLSTKDLICIYADNTTELLNTLICWRVMQQNGVPLINLYYLNFDFRTLSSDLITQENPIWKPIKNKYKFVGNLITADEIAKKIKKNDKNFRILDVRPVLDFEGVTKKWEINGNIKTSLNLPWTNLFIPNNNNTGPSFTFKSKKEIETIIKSSPYNTSEYNETAITCNTSGEGSALYFAMIAIINYQLKNVKTFEGSWNVWNRLYAKKPNKYPSNIPNL